MNRTVTRDTSRMTSGSAAWPSFADRLANALRSLEKDQYLIVSVKGGNRYVQFACGGEEGWRAETTSDAYLSKEERLKSQQISALIDAGWNAPSRAPSETKPKGAPPGSPNFFLDFEASVPVEEVADLAVHTLADILRIPHPGFLEYKAFHSGGRQIELPALGIARVKQPPKQPPQDLRGEVLAVVRQVTGLDQLAYDDDGDIGFRSGSSGALVRLIGEPAHVQLRAPILHEVELSPELLARLNDINAHETVTRFVYRSEGIWAVAEICAVPFVPEHLTQTLQRFVVVADAIDSVLREEFGGRTAFPETLPSTMKH